MNESSDKSSEDDMWLDDNNNNTSSPFTLWSAFVNVQYTALTEILAHARWTAVRHLPEVGLGGRTEGAVGIVSCWPNAYLYFPSYGSNENLLFVLNMFYSGNEVTIHILSS